MTPAEILRAAKEKISDPARWCKFVCAVDADGRARDPEDAHAAQWCAYGAVGWASPCTPDCARAFDLLKGVAPNGCVAALNDTGTHADVMAMFDRAIALAEKEA